MIRVLTCLARIGVERRATVWPLCLQTKPEYLLCVLSADGRPLLSLVQFNFHSVRPVAEAVPFPCLHIQIHAFRFNMVPFHPIQHRPHIRNQKGDMIHTGSHIAGLHPAGFAMLRNKQFYDIALPAVHL